MLIAPILALAVALPLAAQPAQAQAVPPGPSADRVINAVLAGFSIFRGNVSPANFQALKDAIVPAVNAAAVEVNDHIDGVVVANINGHLEAMRGPMADYEVWRGNEFMAWDLAHQWNIWAGYAKGQLERQGLNRASGNAIGFALNVVYSNAILAFDEIGYQNTQIDLLTQQIEANEYMVQHLKPTCGFVATPLPEGHSEFYRCAGANGTVVDGEEIRTFIPGVGYVNDISQQEKDSVLGRAGANTSWAVALHVLPELRRALEERTRP
jgi:hypothetical protein